MLPRVRIAMASKRNDFTLAQKYEVVKTAKPERKIGVRNLGQIFGCGKTHQYRAEKQRKNQSYMKLMPQEIRVTPVKGFVSQNFLK